MERNTGPFVYRIRTGPIQPDWVKAIAQPLRLGAFDLDKDQNWNRQDFFLTVPKLAI
ncbi:hypothetical protein [Thalassospira alkalitolerans]|uniref:hypothetical protein n=1 Tax=Thalassospira alkalitolerans TaxID=1293890 RepID=UPI003AA8A933|tara:strand:+ start:107171 stop:107341 length:171 start_codon:yes stop_codon:yes gene_type:complete